MVPAQPRHVRDVMTARPAVVQPDVTIRDLVRLIAQLDYDVFPVVDPSGTLLGIVSKLDVLRIFRPEPLREVPDMRQLGAQRVADIMRPGVVTLEPGAPLVAAVDLMLESRLHGLPVVERRHGRAPALVGMVSRGDLLRALISEPAPSTTGPGGATSGTVVTGAKPTVVAVDGSPESARAAALAWQVARATGAGCRLVHAAAGPVGVEPGVEFLGAPPEAFEAVAEHARLELGAALKDVVPPDVVRTLDVRFGRAERVIANAVAEWGAGLVVIGGRHHGALARRLGLSTAHHLVRMLEVPTLVAGASARPVARIVVAVDLSAAAVATLSAARDLAQRLGAKLRVLHVVEPLRYPSVGPFTIDERLVRQQAAAHFQRLTEVLAEVVPADRVIREGDAAEVIAAEAAGWDADLLVVGSHGRGWMDRLLLGSTTERLLNLLPCSLLVIPVREEHQAARTQSRASRRRRRPMGQVSP